MLGPHVEFGTLGWVLPIAGIGLGMLLVPVTSVPLTVVPPERSGMAASATNTSREMGAVFGVSILGAIVNAKLTGDLAAKLKKIGIPPNFQSLVEHAIQTGGAGSGGAASTAEHSKNAAVAPSPPRWSARPTTRSGQGLHEALLLSGILILAGARGDAGHRAGPPQGHARRLAQHRPRGLGRPPLSPASPSAGP